MPLIPGPDPCVFNTIRALLKANANILGRGKAVLTRAHPKGEPGKQKKEKRGREGGGGGRQ